MAHHNNIVEARLLEDGRYFSIENSNGHCTLVGFDINTHIVGFHVFQFRMLLSSEWANNAVVACYRERKLAFVRFETAGEFVLFVVHRVSGFFLFLFLAFGFSALFCQFFFLFSQLFLTLFDFFLAFLQSFLSLLFVFLSLFFLFLADFFKLFFLLFAFDADAFFFCFAGFLCLACTFGFFRLTLFRFDACAFGSLAFFLFNQFVQLLVEGSCLLFFFAQYLLQFCTFGL